jgi:L-malate glycosyltransferase
MQGNSKRLTIFMSFPTSILTDYQASGDGLLAFQYISRLGERGHSIHVVCEFADIDSYLPDNIALYPISNEKRENGKTSRLRYFLQSRKIFNDLSKKYKFDLVHELNPGFTGLSLAFLGVKIPVIIGPISSKWPTDSNYLISSQLQLYGIKFISTIKFLIIDSIRYLQQLHASVLLLSTPGAGSALGMFGYNQAKGRVLPIGIDNSLFSASSQYPESEPIILFLAVLEIRKGIFTLLDAFDDLAKRLPNCKIIIAGSGSQAETIQKRIEMMPYKQQISFVGSADRSSVVKLMQSCSVFCLPSYGEPFGISILEAMASGKPVVTTDAGGPKYIVQDQGGRRVPPRDAKALADALFEVLNSQELQINMGKFNRDLINTIYSWDGIIDKLEKIYFEVC